MDKLNSTINKTYDCAKDIFFCGRKGVEDNIDDQGYARCHNDAFVTELNANHLADKRHNPKIHKLLYKINTTDSTSEYEELSIKIAKLLLKMNKELMSIRKKTFVLKNENTPQVYGELAKNYSVIDRDNYIQSLSNFHDIIIQLGEGVELDRSDDYRYDSYNFIVKEKNLAMKALGILRMNHKLELHLSSPIYGDLNAISCLNRGISARVPDLTFNCWQERCD